MFQYRFCTEEDFPVWLELNRAFMEEEIQDNSLWNCVDQDETEKFYRTFCKARKENDFIRLFLFEVDGQTIGFANVLIIFSVWAHGKALVLDDLYLLPEFRGKGFGGQALQFIETYAQQIGCMRLQFQSEESNRGAMKFYKAMGYTPMDMKFYVKSFEVG